LGLVPVLALVLAPRFGFATVLGFSASTCSAALVMCLAACFLVRRRLGRWGRTTSPSSTLTDGAEAKPTRPMRVSMEMLAASQRRPTGRLPTKLTRLKGERDEPWVDSDEA